MADITTANSIGESYSAPTVATKDNLTVATAWTSQPFLFCDSLELRCNTWDVARLSYDFGEDLRQPGYERDADWETNESHKVKTWSQLDLTGKFVRVSYGGTYWYGYIVGEDKERTNDGDGNLTGQRQFFRAVGLAYFLARKQIRTAVIHDGVEIGRGLVFNGGDNARILGADRKGRANMHPADDSNGLRCFYDQQDTASAPELWSATQILDHVLQYHGMKSFGGAFAPAKFERSIASASCLDDWYPTIRTDNRTPLDVLNALANPRRGLCWWVDYSDSAAFYATGEINVRVSSLTPSSISLGQSAGSLPANADQESLSYDGDRHVLRSKLGTPDSRAYKQVVCRGARQTGTGTFGFADSTLRANWDAITLEPDYLSAASATTGYGSLTTEEKQKRNDAMRRQSEFASVFASFAVPSNWDGLVGDGEGGVTDAPLFPDVSSAGSATGTLSHYWSGLRVLPRLMIAPGGSAPDRDVPEYERMLVLVKVATSPDRYQFVDKLTDADFSSGTAVYSGTPASYAARPEAEVFGIRVRSVRINHTLAKNHFGSAAPTAVTEQLDYETLRCTVSVEGDHHAEGIYPLTLGSNVILESLTVDMGDNYRLDWVVPGTVIGLDEGQDVSHAGGVIRDDRAVLADFARFAYEWYSADRRTLEVSWARVDASNFGLGKMITTVGEGTGQTTVNTVIGSIAYDFGTGATTIRTLPDQLDLPGLLS